MLHQSAGATPEARRRNAPPADLQKGPLDEGFDAPLFFREIISLVPGIIYIFNHKKQSNEFSNHSIATLLGYSSQEILDMGDQMLASIIHRDDLPKLAVYFGEMQDLADGETAMIEYRAIARDGSIVWLRSLDRVFQRAPDGSVLRHIGIANDVTEQVTHSLDLAEVNETLAERTTQLQHTNEELEQLAYIATHDLKAPMSNLSHLMQLLEEAVAPEEGDTADIIGWMRTSCEQANEKLSALVRVAQVRSGDLVPPEDVDLAAATKAACATLSREISEYGAEVSQDFSEAPIVLFPKYEMASILENLIGNGLKYSHPDRRPQITLRSQADAQAVRMTVRDNGRGLSLPRDIEKVFGLFKRAHVDPPGSGIALYTIRKMLERYGGSITVDSVEGAWTEFALVFPSPETI